MYSSLRTALLTGGLTFSVIVGTLSVYALGAGTDLVSLMDKMLLDTSVSTDWTVKNADKVDGLHASDILNAAGGWSTQCYKPITATSAYPTCAAGYTRLYGVYGTLIDTNQCTLTFENNMTGLYHSAIGNIYLWYEMKWNSPYTFTLYDSSDTQLTYLSNYSTISMSPGIFKNNNSTIYGNTSTTNASITTYNDFDSPLCTFWYAVCCK